MSVNQVKLLAAGLLVACGLGLGGIGWLNTADAQSKPIPQSPEERVKRLEEELAKAKKEAAEKAKPSPDTAQKQKYEYFTTEVTRVRKVPATAFQTAKWEYEFADMAETFDAANLALFLQEREKAGWEFLGSSALAKNGGVPMWLFRRAKAGAVKVSAANQAKPLGDPLVFTDLRPVVNTATKAADPAGVETGIKKVQDRPNVLLATDSSDKTWVLIEGAGADLEAELIGKLLVVMGTKKFGNGEIQALAAKNDIRVFGSKAVRDWATATVKSLTGK